MLYFFVFSTNTTNLTGGPIDILNMKNSLLNSSLMLPSRRIDWLSPTMSTLNIPARDGVTTADRLLHLKECLDKELIDEALFRALRDELTYGAGFA